MPEKFSRTSKSQINQNINPDVEGKDPQDLTDESELTFSDLDNVVGGLNSPQIDPEPFPGSNKKFVRGSRNADGSYVWVIQK